MILGVNHAAAVIPEIEHIWTQHNNLAKQYKQAAGRPIWVHARPSIMGNDVDYWWRELAWVGGSSGFAGALWAKLGMGFDEVIMVGTPLSAGSNKHLTEYSRVTHFADDHLIIGWQEQVKRHKKDGKTSGIYSMSGFTMKVLGAPPELRA